MIANRVRPGGFGPAVSDPQFELAGMDPAMAMEWAARNAEQDQYDAELQQARQDARAAEMGQTIGSVAKIGKAGMKRYFPDAAPAARDWINSSLGRPVRTGELAKQRYGLPEKSLRTEGGLLRDEGEAYDAPVRSGGQQFDSGPQPTWLADKPQAAAGAASEAAQGAAPAAAAQSSFTPTMPPNPPPTPSVAHIAEAVKPAEGGMTMGEFANGAGSVIGQVLGAASIAEGAREAPMGRAELSHDRGDANRERAVGAVSATAGAMAGAETGAAIGTMFLPGVGTAIGAGIGGAAGAIPGTRRLFGKRAHESEDKSYWNWRWY